MKRQSMLAAAAMVALLFLLTLGAPRASADSTSYTLSNSNLGSSFTGPFGTVTVDLTSSTTATITFTAGSGYVFLDGGIGDVNVNASSWTIGSFSGITCAAGGCDGGGANAIDGFGSFNQTVNSQGGFGDSITTFSFVLTDTGGTWSSATAVLFANGSGGDVAAHIAPTSLGGACTGFASNGTTNSTTPPAGCTSTVPDGGMTLMLLGGALVGLESLRRKFRF
jgi:hypothetical protein